MNSSRFGLHALLVATSLFMAGTAAAEVTVENQIIQSGLFVKPECKPEGIEGFNECSCLADIHTPLLKGLADIAKQNELNASFVKLANQQRCEGKESQTESKEEPASSTFNFEISYQTPTLIALRFENWSYTGGAHGNGAVGGFIIDLQQVRILGLSDIFVPASLPQLNKFINDALSAEPEGEVFHDAIESFKGEFLTDSQCKSCTIVLAEDGLKVVFQTYAVSSFANGPMEVQVPAQYVAYPALQEAFKNLKPTTPTQETK